ncbi:hypothetical protein [Paraliobacillus ryukyuensis]|uniref:hypothetical protein n=1 Tax=Paraliobacillus ryukyuensis TaxID=200904 RepID=UPI0009A7AAAF|nr:hypothetical protein [Paraliobacillus ryukyuensis]
MIYTNNIIRMFTHMEEQLDQLKQAETVKGMWKRNVILILATMIIYAGMAYLGLGTNLISEHLTETSTSELEVQKLWFLLGRSLYGCLFAILVLFTPSLFYFLLTDTIYRKLVVMQQVVLIVILLERVIWIIQSLLFGLDWYVSLMSFGIIASYIFEKNWLIYFFGAISIFQLWLIWFQTKYLIRTTNIKKHVVWMLVLTLHLVGWALAAAVASIDTILIGGWFN